jgi:hypothetical protein
MASRLPASKCSNFEKRRHPGFALGRKPAPRRMDQDDGFAVGAADTANLDRQVFGARCGNFGAAFQDGSRFGEWVDKEARADARKTVQTVAHGGHDAEVAAAGTDRGRELDRSETGHRRQHQRVFDTEKVDEAMVRPHRLFLRPLTCGRSQLRRLAAPSRGRRSPAGPQTDLVGDRRPPRDAVSSPIRRTSAGASMSQRTRQRRCR